MENDPTVYPKNPQSKPKGSKRARAAVIETEQKTIGRIAEATS